MAWIAKAIVKIAATIKNFLLDLFIPMSNDIIFGKIATW